MLRSLAWKLLKLLLCYNKLSEKSSAFEDYV